jgi:hypothetical protein
MKIDNEEKAKICLFLAAIPLVIWFTYYIWNLPLSPAPTDKFTYTPPPTRTEKFGEAAGNTTRRFVKGMFRGIFYNDR